MDWESYIKLHPEAAEWAFHGERPDRGKIVVGQQYPGEGYAILKCGGTEVQIGYSLLHATMLRIDKESPRFAELSELQKAIHSIACEASMGRKGD